MLNVNLCDNKNQH